MLALRDACFGRLDNILCNRRGGPDCFKFILPACELSVYITNARTMYEICYLNTARTNCTTSAAQGSVNCDPILLRSIQKYEATLSALAFFVMPTAAILSVTGQDLAVILLGEKWRQSGLLLSIMALRGIVEFIEMIRGLAACFVREGGALEILGYCQRSSCGWRQFWEVSLWRRGRGRSSRGGGLVGRLSFGPLCRPAIRHWRRSGDPSGGRPVARRHNRGRRGLVAASKLSRRLFNSLQDMFLGLSLRLDLSFDRCGAASHYRAD